MRLKLITSTNGKGNGKTPMREFRAGDYAIAVITDYLEDHNIVCVDVESLADRLIDEAECFLFYENDRFFFGIVES